MSNIFRTAISRVALAVVMMTVPLAAAKKPSEPAAAPMPIQLTTGKKVFISYRESDADPGAPDLTYNEFYGLMKYWGKYELVRSPADVDLVFEIRYISGISDSQLCLSIVDAKTRFVLWPLVQHVQSSTRETSRRKNFDAAMADLISDLKNLTTPPVASK